MSSEVERSGVAHSAGDLVIICSRNGDPPEFTDPDEFGLDRGLRNDIAF
jgi:cytochrome P450